MAQRKLNIKYCKDTDLVRIIQLYTMLTSFGRGTAVKEAPTRKREYLLWPVMTAAVSASALADGGTDGRHHRRQGREPAAGRGGEASSPDITRQERSGCLPCRRKYFLKLAACPTA